MLNRLLHSALILLASLAPAAAFETKARAAWVYDLTTQTVLLEKDADVPLPPASMSKLMTLNMLFEALRAGTVQMDTRFSVSTKARSMGGSTMFLNEMDRPTVEDLIHGIIINSGNDACVVVAEGLAGSEETFARQMTERARALGMRNSTFVNSSGWPAEGHRMSPHDLGLLATRMITEFPEYYPFFGMTGFNYEGRAPANANNRNPLLGLGVGADGLKTGHTQEAGYGLVGSAEQNGRRIVFVLSGLGSEAERAQEAEALTNWAFRQFVLRTLARSGTRLAEAEVHMGAAETVGLVVEKDLTLLLPALALAQEGVKAEAVYNGPVAAPIAAGQVLGELVLDLPEMEDVRVPLVAEADVPVGGFGKHLSVAAGALMARVSGDAGS
ncbi:MAG: D-alanyl-D-alanine carboxypeptidase [Defluviimonas sp.]|nr:D-alanyl-D-alanine carboxypeptidase [Defluviimonas sp.]